MRVDKWLHVARVFKTRSQATRACNLGRVQVNGSSAKPHKKLVVGDRVEVDVLDDWQRVLVVKLLRNRPMRKADVPTIFDDLSTPRPVRDPLERLLRQRPVVREKGAGRPTKRDRRRIDTWERGPT